MACAEVLSDGRSVVGAGNAAFVFTSMQPLPKPSLHVRLRWRQSLSRSPLVLVKPTLMDVDISLLASASRTDLQVDLVVCRVLQNPLVLC